MIHLKLKQIFLLAVVFFISASFCIAQSIVPQGRIAILPFNGGSPDEREGIAELFSFTPQIMRNFTVIPRTTITNAISIEQSFQLSSGMTDADTIARLGQQFGADYVMEGSITALGASKLLIVSIIRIDVIQQVAGDFIIYNSLDDLVNNQSILIGMTENLISIMQKNAADTGMERLAIVPVLFSDDVNHAEGDALAQLLSIHLIRNGKYAIYPRTQTLDQVQREYNNQMSGITRDDHAVVLGKGVNPEFVLSIASRRIGNSTTFNASVIDLEKGHQIDGFTEPYANLSDGINAMDFIARKLSGVEVSERERTDRTTSISGPATSEEKDKKRQASMEKILKNSLVNLTGWFGFDVYSLAEETAVENDSSAQFIGGPLVEFRLGRFFGLETGLNIIGIKNIFADTMNSSTLLQLPILAKVTIGNTLFFTPYFGLGINISNIDRENDVEIKYLSRVNIIAGANFGMVLDRYDVFIGFQYNGDVKENEISFDGQNYNFNNRLFLITLGFGYRIPLVRQKATGQ